MGRKPWIIWVGPSCHKALIRGMVMEPEPDGGSSCSLASRGSPLSPRKSENTNSVFLDVFGSCLVWTWSGPQRLMLMVWSQLLLLLLLLLLRGPINPIMGLWTVRRQYGLAGGGISGGLCLWRVHIVPCPLLSASASWLPAGEQLSLPRPVATVMFFPLGAQKQWRQQTMDSFAGIFVTVTKINTFADDLILDFCV